MRKGIFAGITIGAASFGLFAMTARDAEACGGCFHPPTETPTVVTDHRMLFSVSQSQTTLYDQIKYQGSPESFAWVLPIVGTVQVGLSADVVFGALDQYTQTSIEAPPQNCPGLPPSCQTNGSVDAGVAFPSAGGSSGSSGGVSVIKQEVVGPYETVQLQSTTQGALETWLQNNGFAIPAEVQPVVDYYVGKSFNFLALKLLPGKGVQDMRPVRVTSTGASVTLPLRMVGAGSGATVGITLWVLSEGRYETQNFPSFHINDDELAWDWTQMRSNYTDLRAAKTAAGGGRIWEIESSIPLPSASIKQVISGYSYPGEDPTSAEQQAQQDYLPVTDSSGTVIKTAVQARDEDIATVFAGIDPSSARVTRIRGDIAHAKLDDDLVLAASSDQSELPNQRKVTKELNEPLCPVYQDCQQIGTAPRSQVSSGGSGSGSASDGSGTFACSTTQQKANATTTLVMIGVGALAIVLSKRKRRDGGSDA